MECKNVCAETTRQMQARGLPVDEDVIRGCRLRRYSAGEDTHDNIWSFGEVGRTGDDDGGTDLSLDGAWQRRENHVSWLQRVSSISCSSMRRALSAVKASRSSSDHSSDQLIVAAAPSSASRLVSA